MKTRLLIIIGIVVVAVSLSYYVIYNSSTTVFVSCDPRYMQIEDKCVLLKPEQYCTDWCDLQELSSLGCNQPVLDYIFRYTSLFDEKFDGTYAHNFVGLPDGVSKEKFEECVDFIYEKRTSIESEPPFREEHYSIEITGMKDIYRIGEQYDFSYIISGYGNSCGSKTITFPDQDGNTMKTISNSSCIAGVPMKEFVLDSQKQYDTTSVHGTIKIPGIYNVTVTFDRPSQEFPTTAIKEFRVPPINSWYNNQTRDTDLQTVIDSCANDSAKERMTNSLRYTNDTHVFMNHGCEWHTLGTYVGENEN